KSHCRRLDRTARSGNCNLGAPAIAPIAANASRSRRQAEPLLARCPWLFSPYARKMKGLSSFEAMEPCAPKSVLYDPLKFPRNGWVSQIVKYSSLGGCEI